MYRAIVYDPYETSGRLLPSTSSLHAAGVHSFSAASAGAIATLATHPFDVVKVSIRISFHLRLLTLV